MVGGALAGPGRLEHQRQLLADPLLADDLGERAGPQRRLDGALVAVGLGATSARAGALSTYACSAASRPDSSERRLSTGSCLAQGAQGGAQQGGDVGLRRPSSPAAGRDGLDRPVGLLRRPAEPDQAGVHLAAPGLLRRRAAGGATGAPAAGRRSGP